MTPAAPDDRRWSWKIGSLAGIAIYLHVTFVLLLAGIAVLHVAAGHDIAIAARGVLLIVAVFAVVVLHELGHALVARRYGVRTRDITLYPIGGIARLEGMPDRAWHELLVAVAGPAVNIAIAAALYLGLRTSGHPAGAPLAVGGSFAVQLMWINLSLAVFNLLPAFPMDGGRILRALLSMWLTRDRATRLAARIGRAIAIGLGLVGALYSPTLLVIAVFVWIAGTQEAALEQLKTSMRGLTVRDAMIADFAMLPPTAPLDAVAERIATGYQHDFPVLDGTHVVGMVTRDDVARGLLAGTRDIPIANVMHRDLATARASEDLEAVVPRLPRDGSALLVIDGDTPVGLLDPAHLGELLQLRAATARPL
ncbi:MAG TPA: site-2 protease family protein [Kofleriaceae bacterium]|nr:site-2 protease family protein [Kofleriaceae bacterium]